MIAHNAFIEAITLNIAMGRVKHKVTSYVVDIPTMFNLLLE